MRMRRKKPVPTTEGTAPAPAGRVMPDPMREMWPLRPSYVRRANQRRPAVPRLRPGEAEALAQAEHARRRLEQEAERTRLKAELAAKKAMHEAYVESLYEEFERGSRWISPGDNGHGDMRRIKF
jgi:hypothetical protein